MAAALPTPVVSAGPQFLSRKEAAQYLNVSEKWLAQSGRTNGPRFYKFGGRCRYHLKELDEWVRQQKVVMPRAG